MSVGLFLLLLVVVVGLVIAVPSVVAFASGSGKRTELREARTAALEAKAREKMATKALRSIANGAGNPSLEAQIALDEIDASYYKELN